MTHQRLAGSGALLIALVLWSIPSGRIAAQRPAAANADAPAVGASWNLERHLDLVRTIRGHIGVKDDYQPPRTAWGHPDLEGAWTSDAVHGVPRDRPAQFGTRMFLTDAEFTEREALEAKTREAALNAAGVGTAGRDRAWRGDITFRLTSLDRKS